MSTGPETQEWQNGLCSCGPCGTCLLGTCVPAILYGRTSKRLENGPNDEISSCNGSCGLFCGLQMLFGFGWILAMTKRTQIRERYGIEGSGFSDCCTAFWCPCCALIQQDKEVKERLLKEADKGGYEAQGQMEMKQQ